MVNEIIAAGLQVQQMKMANQYAAAMMGQIKSVQEMVGAEAVELIDGAMAESLKSVSVDPNLGQNIDVVV